MPRQSQQCPFCQKPLSNKKALHKHLTSYIGEWRFPADGKHDALQIQSHLRQDRQRYQCWTCSKILNSRGHFREHVIYRGHCGLKDSEASIQVKKPSRRDWDDWLLPFDEELVIVKDESFQFLGLPTGT